MNNTNDNSKSSENSDFDNSGTGSDTNQENDVSENGGNHFFLLIGDENNDLGDAIKKWESIRFGM